MCAVFSLQRQGIDRLFSRGKKNKFKIKIEIVKTLSLIV